MKNKSYISRDYPKACRYCETGRLSPDKSAVLCPVRGVTDPDGCCRKYIYDPLKREVTPYPVQMDYSPDEFSL